MVKAIMTVVVLALSTALSAAQSLREYAQSYVSAIDFLLQTPAGPAGSSSYDCKTYEAKNIRRLDPQLAERVAIFIREWNNLNYPRIRITSAFRSAQEQMCVCEGEKGPCAWQLHTKTVYFRKKVHTIAWRGKQSEHQGGNAIDVSAISKDDSDNVVMLKYRCMHEFAKFNPQFGLDFPYGDHDRPHAQRNVFQKSNVRFESWDASVQNVVPCNALPRRIGVPDDAFAWVG